MTISSQTAVPSHMRPNYLYYVLENDNHISAAECEGFARENVQIKAFRKDNVMFFLVYVFS